MVAGGIVLQMYLCVLLWCCSGLAMEVQVGVANAMKCKDLSLIIHVVCCVSVFIVNALLL